MYRLFAPSTLIADLLSFGFGKLSIVSTLAICYNLPSRSGPSWGCSVLPGVLFSVSGTMTKVNSQRRVIFFPSRTGCALSDGASSPLIRQIASSATSISTKTMSTTGLAVFVTVVVVTTGTGTASLQVFLVGFPPVSVCFCDVWDGGCVNVPSFLFCCAVFSAGGRWLCVAFLWGFA